MTEDDPKPAPQFTFGDFAIDGFEDPLAPHASAEYVELLDSDPPPIVPPIGDPDIVLASLGRK